MGFIIAAFRSRTQTLEFYDTMQRNGVPCSIVNTPKEARVGCGISVRFTANFISKARYVLSKGKYTNFAGFFSVTKSNNKTVVRIYN